MFSGAIKSGNAVAANPNPPATNPPFNTVVALLHSDGTNGQVNYPLTDTSNTPLTLSSTGVAAATQFSQGTFGPFKSAYSVDCRVANAPIFTIANNTVFAMGTGTFTMECWVYPYSYGTIRGIVDIYDSNSVGRVALRLTTTGAVQLAGGAALATNIVTTTGTLTLNTWSHIAVVRSGTGAGQVVVYINGTADATTGTSATSFTNTVGNVHLCCDAGTTATATPARYFDGLISQLRIVKAVAVYTGAFTVPTSVLASTQSANPYGGSNTAAITGSATSLLTFVRPYFVDLSANALPMFRGTAAVNNSSYPWFVPQIPIPNATIDAPTTPAAWSAASFGGSYGNIKTISSGLRATSSGTALALGNTGDFTMEFWCYVLIINTRMEFLDINTSGTTARIDIYIHPTTYCMIVFANNSDYFTSTTTAKSVALIGTWSHIALTRSSTTTSMFWNGVRIATSTAAISAGTTNTVADLGIAGSYVQALYGGARVIKGTAQYTAATYTVPTAPFTSTGSQTSLLINAGTSAPMVDYSMNQVWGAYTATNPSVSTSIVKYGTGSLNINAQVLTGQSISASGNQGITFGTGNFTVEGWFYANTSTSNKGIFQIAFTAAGTGAGQTGLALAYSTSSNLRLYYGAASIVAGTASTVTTTAWVHFAIVRYGTGASNLTVYINGVADSALIVTDSYNYPSSYIVIGSYYDNTHNWTGYLDDFRISKYAVYTSNFAPPTAAFSDL